MQQEMQEEKPRQECAEMERSSIDKANPHEKIKRTKEMFLNRMNKIQERNIYIY